MTQVDEFLAELTEDTPAPADDNSWLTEDSMTPYEPKPKGERKPGTGKGRKRLALPANVIAAIEAVEPFALKAPTARDARSLIHKVRTEAKVLGRGMEVDQLLTAEGEVTQRDIAKNGTMGAYNGAVAVAFVPTKEPRQRN